MIFKLKSLVLLLVSVVAALTSFLHHEKAHLGVPPVFPINYSVSITPDPVAGAASSGITFSIPHFSTGMTIDFSIDSKLYASWNTGKAVSEEFKVSPTGQSHLLQIVANNGISQFTATSTIIF